LKKKTSIKWSKKKLKMKRIRTEIEIYKKDKPVFYGKGERKEEKKQRKIYWQQSILPIRTPVNTVKGLVLQLRGSIRAF
jgi:hypothetical protein